MTEQETQRTVTDAYPAAVHPVLAGAPQSVGIGEIIELVRRRFVLIIGITLLLTALAALALSRVAPRYSAEALLMIDARSNNLVDLDAAIAGLSGDPETIQSEIEVLRSRRLVNKIIEQLELYDTPEFNSALRPPGVLGRFFGGGSEANATPSPMSAAATTETLIEGQRVQVIDAFLDRLSVGPRTGSRVISIEFSSEDARLAAQVANALADLYLQDQLESKFETVQRATNWLQDRVATLREKVEASERLVEEYRQSSGLLEGGGVTLNEQEISQLNAQMVQAGTVADEANARLQQVQSLLESPGGAESAAEVLGSMLIQRLREQEAGVLRQVAELSAEYGERHPTMIKLRAEAADLQAKIAAEMNKIVDGLEYEARIADSTKRSLTASLNAAKRRTAEANQAHIKLRALERDAAANRLLLETMLVRFTETSAQDDMTSQQPDARIISRALVADSPSFPMTKAILALVMLGGGFLGFMIALGLEFMDQGFRAGEQVESMTGMRSLGFVPRIGRRELGDLSPDAFFVNNLNSNFAEGLRSLYCELATSVIAPRPKTILITSALPDEGKTTIAACLARLVSGSNARAIIIDADFRKPSIHAAFGLPNQNGLIEYLDGKISIDEVVTSDPESGADVVVAGQPARNPPATLASPRLDELLVRFGLRYDYIFIDSPPIIAVSDALIVTGRVDATVLIAKWGATKRSAVRLTLKRIAGAGGKVAGVLLSMVDVRKYARYDYGDSGTYAGRLTEYGATK